MRVNEVNPAYTSIIGRVKFAKRYGLTVHQAAALCIARRLHGFSEQPPKQLENIPDGKRGHVAIRAPVRKRGKHVWSFWRLVRRRVQAARAAHFRAVKNRSTDPPEPMCVTGKISKGIGGIPIGESSAVLLG